MSERPLPTVVSAEYLAEVRDLSTLPAPDVPEIAIAGRSNVGKSTLLNRLAQRKGLARTSKTPGRTRGLMFYDLGVRLPGATAVAPLRLVDLPGYGYATGSPDERRSWKTLIEGFVEHRPALRLMLALVDPRRGVEGEERELIEWLDSLGLPHQLVATKIDKLSASEKGLVRERLRKSLPTGRPPVLTSGDTGEGVDRLWLAIVGAAFPANEPPRSDGA